MLCYNVGALPCIKRVLSELAKKKQNIATVMESELLFSKLQHFFLNKLIVLFVGYWSNAMYHLPLVLATKKRWTRS